MINPFDLRGPEFLFFYAVLAVFVNLLCGYLIKKKEGGHDYINIVDDPYLIAALRGGEIEAIRVALLSLIDRGLIKAENAKSVSAIPQASSYARKDLDKAIIDSLPGSIKSVYSNYQVKYTVQKYVDDLRINQLIPDGDIKSFRFSLFLLFSGILICVALFKIYLAYLRGKSNVQFLILLCIFSVILLLMQSFKRQTALGVNTIKQTQNKFFRLKQNANEIRPGGETNELALLAAVFGATAIPLAMYPYARTIFPRPDNSSAWMGDGGSSSCSGSSCGGGGCGGGGCGGCGGS